MSPERERTIQLLPPVSQARVLRDALNLYLTRDDLTEDQRDIAWRWFAEITRKITGESF